MAESRFGQKVSEPEVPSHLLLGWLQVDITESYPQLPLPLINSTG